MRHRYLTTHWQLSPRYGKTSQHFCAAQPSPEVTWVSITPLSGAGCSIPGPGSVVCASIRAAHQSGAVPLTSPVLLHAIPIGSTPVASSPSRGDGWLLSCYKPLLCAYGTGSKSGELCSGGLRGEMLCAGQVCYGGCTMFDYLYHLSHFIRFVMILYWKAGQRGTPQRK